jgi:putative membrane protein
VRVARWALPVWLYVSVTGVAVYWMLYRLYPGP